MELDVGQWIVIGVCAVLILGYITGYYYNRQKAQKISEWLHAGLREWGAVTPGERLPGMASGGRLRVNQARGPFQRIAAVYLLEPRENLLFWAFHRLQGRHDELILSLDMKVRPDQEVEVAGRLDQDFRRRLKKTKGEPAEVETGPKGLRVAWWKKKGSGLSARLSPFLEKYGAGIIRLSVRREQPYIFLRAQLSPLQREPAQAFFSSLRDLAG
jgi:hypothetical protein